MKRETYYGVFRVLKIGGYRYIPRTCTASKKLAQDIADERGRGEITMPDGTIRQTKPIKCVVAVI